MLKNFNFNTCSKNTQEKNTESEREGAPVDAFQKFQQQEEKNEAGLHSVGSYDRILGEGQDDFDTAQRLPGSFDAAGYGRSGTSTSTTRPVETNLGQKQGTTEAAGRNVPHSHGTAAANKATGAHLGRDEDPENVTGMYNMNLGEKTNIKTGQTQGGHRVDQPLESYIPGVGRQNKASEAMFPHTAESGITQTGHHATHTGSEKPLEAYIPGVGRNNQPEGHPEPYMQHPGHSSEPQIHGAGRNTSEQHHSKNHSSTPQIPDTGVISGASHSSTSHKLDPRGTHAYGTDTQQTSHLSQKNAVPGFDYGNKLNISGPNEPTGSDTVDRSSVPKPAHLNESANSGANAPVRRDSRTVNQFHEPEGQQSSTQRRTSKQDEKLDFPAHAYDAHREDTSKLEGTGHSTLDPIAAAAQKGREAGIRQHIQEERTHGSQKANVSGHESRGTHEQTAQEGKKSGLFGHETHGSHHEQPRGLGQEPAHEGKKTGLFGHETHTQGKSHGSEKDVTAGETSPKSSGPTLFGKTINFGGSHKDHKDHKDHHEHGQETTHNKSAAVGGSGHTKVSSATATKVGHMETPGVESKHLPSKTATTSDQPVQSTTQSGSGAKTIGSDEAGSYAHEVCNNPSLIDPRVPTYGFTEESTSTGRGGEFNLETSHQKSRGHDESAHTRTSGSAAGQPAGFGESTHNKAGSGTTARIGHEESSGAQKKHLASETAASGHQPSSRQTTSTAYVKTENVGSHGLGHAAHETHNTSKPDEPRFPAKTENIGSQGVGHHGHDTHNVSRADEPRTSAKNENFGTQGVSSHAHGSHDMPNPADSQAPIYRHKEEFTTTGKDGAYQVHSEKTSYTRNVSVGDESNKFHGASNISHQQPGGELRGEQSSHHPEGVPRSHGQEHHEEHDSHKKHSEPGFIEKVKNTITSHNN